MSLDRFSRCALVVCAFGAWACANSGTVPPPEPTIARYAEALKRGDADVLYGMLNSESKRAVSKDELKRILKDQKGELAEHAKAVSGGDRAIEARAKVRFADGEVVSLDLVDGKFRIAAADALPAAARTPTQALGQLRSVLARRSYSGLLRVMSPKTRAAMERDLRSLVEGLSEPEALQVDVVGDAASVTVPGGHQVKLKREDGVWHIEDFD
jgi:hypothetical protein